MYITFAQHLVQTISLLDNIQIIWCDNLCLPICDLVVSLRERIVRIPC